MVDPTDALVSFQEAFSRGELRVQRCELDGDLYVHIDQAGEAMRLTYVRIEGRTVTAFANFCSCEPIDGLPTFQAGCAVPERYRNQGRGKSVLRAAIEEMRHGFRRAGMKEFYIEGIVGRENVASHHMSLEVLSRSPVEVTDEVSGTPASQYVLKVR